MTGCGCPDPAVFGHGDRCERELGPVSAGGHPGDPGQSRVCYCGTHGPTMTETAERRYTDRIMAARERWRAILDRR